MNVIVTIIDFIFYLAPIWLPILLLMLAWKLWFQYIQQSFISGMTWDLLEIKVPRDIAKTPEAMEFILTNALYQVSSKGVLELYWQGSVPFWSSLEIVSIGGQVHFYIRVPTRITDLVEAQIYAQYPQAEVIKSKDYTDELPDKLGEGSGWKIWGCEFQPHNHMAYPIRTYVDFGLDKPSDKEDQKNDPLTPTIEYLGSIKPDERIWIQIIIRGNKMMFKKKGSWFKKIEWKDYVHEEYLNLLKDNTRIHGDGPGKGGSVEIRVPDDLKTQVDGMQHKLSKLGFDTGIRLIYAAKEHAYNNNTQKASRTLFRQFSALDSNRLERTNSTQYDYPFFDPTGKFSTSMKERTLEQYKRREYFHPKIHRSFKYPWPISLSYPSHHPNPFVMSSEEIVTLFHFPGRVSETPTFKRIESRKAAPPSNLPI
jgi:hypothetical protein